MSNPNRSLGRRSFLASTLLAAGSVPAAASGTSSIRGRRSAAPRTLEVVATEEAELYYRFAVDGDVERTKTSDTVGANADNDALVGGADPDTVVVRGFTGNPGYGDAYDIDGEVVSFVRTAGSSDFYVRLGGERVPVDDLNDGDGPFDPGPARDLSRSVDGTFEVVSTEEAELYYRFAVEGDVERTETSDTVGASGNDALVGGADASTVVVRGFTGNPGYGDAFDIDGELQSFRRMGGSSDFYVRLDGQRHGVDELADGDESPALDAEVTCYHTAATVDAAEYDRVTLSMTDGTAVEFADGYAGETTFGYAGDHAVGDGDVTVDEFHGALEEITVVRGDRTQTFQAAENVPGSDGVAVRQLRDVVFDGSVVEPTISDLGPCELSVEFADGTVKSYAHDVGSERFGSPGRAVEAADFTHAPETLADFGVRVPNPAPDDPGADPAVRFDCAEATIEEREFVNRYLGTPGELTVTLTFADGSEQQRTLDDPSFPVTVGGMGDQDGETIEALRATDRAGRSIRVPNSSVGDCD
jgi:hypothetical protein